MAIFNSYVKLPEGELWQLGSRRKQPLAALLSRCTVIQIFRMTGVVRCRCLSNCETSFWPMGQWVSLSKDEWNSNLEDLGDARQGHFGWGDEQKADESWRDSNTPSFIPGTTQPDVPSREFDSAGALAFVLTFWTDANKKCIQKMHPKTSWFEPNFPGSYRNFGSLQRMITFILVLTAIGCLYATGTEGFAETCSLSPPLCNDVFSSIDSNRGSVQEALQSWVLTCVDTELCEGAIGNGTFLFRCAQKILPLGTVYLKLMRYAVMQQDWLQKLLGRDHITLSKKCPADIQRSRMWVDFLMRSCWKFL